ncbi:MAG: glycosyltransferase family 4 protein [Richelia sp. RM2_1_2]|nr:glycosyltransferase family 4 protein [Richelia sp. SM2_1_7]NJM20617.1 glycosyltransferase family 4 protein [Richelia sp. SM1_7_0]NJN13763.1 glycosyltransferase family 4 protein [Richelia sp. RM1_1_1]NJO29181.1 glycosyltransferase family 4 protein [Richelia sp. SL_2_1]NJO65506.1 glycosyltransferase family 4 protein [Richelia sp. RM2_1_2]NJS16675.1 glycosyltransferase family 4 protein [Nostocaceae cyanobacterium CSU_2_110]
MRIAQVAPLWERVPPPGYGGIELVVGLLTDELVRRGHEVTLFASGDSITLANLESVYPRAFRLEPSISEYSAYEALQLSRVYKQASKFDVIHSHVGYNSLFHASFVETPTVHTLHGAFNSDTKKVYAEASEQPYVSISDAQREPMKQLNYAGTVYNGIDTESHRFYAQPQSAPYLAFLGRISPEKGTHIAIEIAQKSGVPLKIAGKVDRVDVDYFESQIKPHVDGKHIEYLGEANHFEKNELLGNAIAMLFPITWREPFGLVMTESMAAGTPVLAKPLGSVPEVIAHGKTGFLCHSVDDYVNAIQRLAEIDRNECRAHVERNFSIKSMVDGYLEVYSKVTRKKFERNGHVGFLANLLMR